MEPSSSSVSTSPSDGVDQSVSPALATAAAMSSQQATQGALSENDPENVFLNLPNPNILGTSKRDNLVIKVLIFLILYRFD